MRNLVNMDLYRMWRSKRFWVCLAIVFVLALLSAPISKLIYSLALSFAPEGGEPLEMEVKLSALISDPFPVMGLMLVFLSLCFFFYADAENGYIKNIAGQMPLKGYTVLSKFLAAIGHNLIFVAAAIIGNLIGTLIVKHLVVDSGVLNSIWILFLKFLLIQCISAILLLVVSTFHSKSLGMILAVLFGLGLTTLIYFGIDEGLGMLLRKDVDITQYMPDSVLKEEPFDTVKALLVSIIGGALFLLLSIRVFDRKDVSDLLVDYINYEKEELQHGCCRSYSGSFGYCRSFLCHFDVRHCRRHCHRCDRCSGYRIRFSQEKEGSERRHSGHRDRCAGAYYDDRHDRQMVKHVLGSA